MTQPGREVRADPEALVRLARTTLTSADTMMRSWSTAQGTVLPGSSAYGNSPGAAALASSAAAAEAGNDAAWGRITGVYEGDVGPAVPGRVRVPAGRRGRGRAAAPGPRRPGADLMTAPSIPPPDPVTMDDVWALAADPGALDRAAEAWRAFGRSAGSARDAVDDAALALRGEAWAGDAADTYHDHREKLGRGVTEVVEAAEVFAVALAASAGALRSAQGGLDDALARVRGAVPTAVAGGRVTFTPRDADDLGPINTAIGEAQRIRGDLDSELVRQAARMDTARTDLASLAGVWARVAAGTDDGWTLPPEATGTSWIYDGRSVVLNTGPGDDHVQVRVDPRTGEQIVAVNGVSTTFPPGYAVTVRAGQGDDTVDVAAGTTVRLTLLGGAGDDTLRGGDGGDRILGLDGRDTVDGRGGGDRITLGASRNHLPGEDVRQPVTERADAGAGDDVVYGSRGADAVLGGDGDDRISGGAGDDTVDGGRGGDVVRGGEGIDNAYGREGADVVDGGDGRDYVDGGAGDDRITGGLGDDTVYGLSGADTVDGGAGRDYLEGGTDNDLITGGAGDDMISGGRGDDTIASGGGNDRIYTGLGRDTVAADGGDDQVYGQAEDAVAGAERTVHVEVSDHATYIKIEGSPEFVERVQADLDMLRASPTGQQMLGNLERAHEDSKHWFYDGDGLTIRELRAENGHANVEESLLGIHEQWQIEYNPSSTPCTTARRWSSSTTRWPTCTTTRTTPWPRASTPVPTTRTSTTASGWPPACRSTTTTTRPRRTGSTRGTRTSTPRTGSARNSAHPTGRRTDMRIRLVPAGLAILTLLAVAGCADDESLAPAGPELKATLDARLTRAPATLTWDYTLRNDETEPIAVFHGPLAGAAGAGPMAWITPRDDETVEVALRLFAPPEGVDLARDVEQSGTVLAPGKSVTGTVAAPIPLELRHPYQSAFDPPLELPDDPATVVFCVGIARVADVGATQPYHHNEGTVAHEHLVCADPEPIAG